MGRLHTYFHVYLHLIDFDGTCRTCVLIETKTEYVCVLPNGELIFQPSIFRDALVSFREGTFG